jgi:dihydrofolate synthase/folylpolyglutamate synthase
VVKPVTSHQADQKLDQILADFNNQIKWLYRLITDPTGSRYFENKDQQTRLREYQEQLLRITDFLKFVNNPQQRFSSVHVTGTSGKGSVAAMTAAILSQCQLRTGFHGSPYLQVVNEKLIIDGEMITPSEFNHLVNQFRQIYDVWAAAGGPFTGLLYTEAWTALVCLWLAQHKVDWAVIETSLGGRFDSTNVLPAKLAIITNVGYDHVESLGPELPDIAYHKAGIIKNNGLVITAATNKAALQVIEEEARQKNARLYRMGQDFDFTVQKMNSSGLWISVQTPFRYYHDVHIAMQGTFQVTNAALAITATDILAEENLVSVSEEAVRTALAQLSFPGRMEIIQSKPLVILDGAHNLHKMQALVTSLRIIYPEKRITAIVGMLMTKDTPALIKSLLPVVSRFVVTKPNVFGKPSLPPEALGDIIQDIAPTIKVHVVDNVKDSIDLALQKLDNDEVLLITGSLYLVGEARDYWLPREQLLKNIELKNQAALISDQ